MAHYRDQVSMFLFSYRLTPHRYGRRVRHHLDQLRGDTTIDIIGGSTSATGTNDDDFLIPMPDQSHDELLSSEEQYSNSDDNVLESGKGLRRSQRTIQPPARYLPD